MPLSPLTGSLAPLSAATSAIAFSPEQVSGLELWLKADGITGLANADPIATWPDSSGNSRDATQATSGMRPTYRTNVVNGKPIVRFDGSDDYFALPNFLTGFTAGEIFCVLKIDADPPATGGATGIGIWGSGIQSHLPWTDGIIYDSFGSTARKTTVDPTPALTSWRLYNVTSKSGEWTSRLDGVQLYTTATNTVGWSSAPILGYSQAALYYLDGDLAELLLFSRELTSGERANVQSYVASKYGLSF